MTGDPMRAALTEAITTLVVSFGEARAQEELARAAGDLLQAARWSRVAVRRYTTISVLLAALRDGDAGTDPAGPVVLPLGEGVSGPGGPFPDAPDAPGS